MEKRELAVCRESLNESLKLSRLPTKTNKISFFYAYLQLIFFTQSLKPKGSFNIDEIATVELMDFNKVLEKVLKGELLDSALVIAALLVSVKGLLHS